MRRISWIFAVLLGIGASTAEAQSQAPQKRFDAAVSAGWLEGKPGPNDTPYGDDWFGAGRYGAQIGYYWTEHLKTEVEFARSGEGEIYLLENRRMPDGGAFSYRVDSIHRVDQLGVRMAYQFGSNQWIHPYVSGGVYGEADRTRAHVDDQMYYPIGARTPILIPGSDSDTHYHYDVGFTVGAGAKFYVSKHAFFNAGSIGTWANSTTGSFSFIAGFGIDF